MTEPRADLLSGVAPELRRSILLSLNRTDDFDTLCGVAMLLGDADAGVAEAAGEALVRQASPEAARAASLRLCSRDAGERARATGVLARLGEYATELLAELANSPDADLRKYAIDTLGMARTAPAGVVERLSALLQDPDMVIAGAAAEALGNLAARDAVPALAACLTRDDLWVRPAALDALARIGGPAAFEAISRLPLDAPDPVVSAAVRALALSSSVDPVVACSRLAVFIDHASRPIAEDALLAIGRILDDPDLTLNRAHPDEMLTAVIAAAPAARLALTHSKPEIRRAGAVVLAWTFVAPADLEALAEILQADADTNVRSAALLALAAHGRLGQEVLGETVRDATAPEVLRVAAIDAMAMDLGSAGEQVLFGLISNGRGIIEESAATALARKGQPLSQRAAVLWLEQAWDELDDPDAVAAAMAKGPGVGAALATVVLDSCDGDLRSALFAAVLRPADARSMGDATQPVLRGVADSDRGVRTHALRLVAAGVPGPFEPAIRLALQDSDARVRVRAMEALGAFPNAADDRAVLVAARTDASGWVRAAALSAASARGCCDVDTIVSAQQDDFAPVRLAALDAALTLAPPAPESMSLEALLRIAVLAQSEDDPSIVDLGRRLETRLS